MLSATYPPRTPITASNPWTHRGREIDGPGDFLGFVYLITCVSTGKKYVGRKLFWFTKTKMVQKKRKRVLVESDWRDYYGSSNSLKADIEKLGRSNFRREILHMCVGKAQMNYLEMREQVERRVLERDDYYNDEIRARVHRHKSLITPKRRK